MRGLLITLLSLLTLVLPVFPQQKLPVHKEPKHHLKFENKYVRVLDVIIPPKTSTLFHTHEEDMVVVTITDASTRIENLGMPPTDSMAGKGGEVWFAEFRKDPITHKVTNTDTDHIHYVAAEILSSSSPSIKTSSLSKVAGYKLELENDRVKVYRLILNPGQSIKMHTYKLPFLAIVVSEGKILIKASNQKPETVEFKPSDFRWRPSGTRHSLKNIGSSRFEMILLEWK